jgi:homoserine trans-succinylase
MEEKKENSQIRPEEIKLLNFQPQQMIDEIRKLKEEISILKIEKNYLDMIIVDLKIDLNNCPKTFKQLFQEMMLDIFGGLWTEEK